MQRAEECRSAMARIKADSDYGHAISELLRDGSLFPDNRLINTLKLVHQKVIFPAYNYVKVCIGSSIEIRDIKGKWRIQILFPHDWDPESLRPKAAKDGVCVTHRRGQRSDICIPGTSDPEFEFDWELTLTTDKEFALMDISVTVHEPRFHESMDKRKQALILRNLELSGAMLSARRRLFARKTRSLIEKK
eukprot:c18635_g1_i4.p1 GENE.c18635_g1_i4~~c18635_g1_i4.p1  ORF type:complete len:191 (+),score=20.27 c18635_g1_i4:354-926(+)